MSPDRVMHMYGDKPPLYTFSICILFFGIGWLFAQYGEGGFVAVFPRVIGLFIVVQFADAIIKSIVFSKEKL